MRKPTDFGDFSVVLPWGYASISHFLIANQRTIHYVSKQGNQHQHVSIVILSMLAISTQIQFYLHMLIMPDTDGGCWVNVRGTSISSHSQVIEDTQHHSKAHVDDPNNNWHLHLVGVEEGQSVHRHVPDLMAY